MHRLLLLGMSSLLLAACANAKYFPDGAVPEAGVCTEGDSRCTTGLHEHCVGGRWLQEKCAAGKICIDKVGCRVCEPGATYCDGQDVFTCSADGQTRSKKTTCLAEQQCVLGSCVGMCDQPAGKDRSNVGCEFWAVDLPNEYVCQSMDGGVSCMLYLCAACQQFAVAVANTQPFPVTVTVEQNDAAPGQALQLTKLKEKVIPASSLEVFELPMREVDCTEWSKDASGRLRRRNDSQSCLSSRAYRVKATAPVVAYQFNPIINDFSNGSSMLLPTSGLDTRYYVLGWRTANPISLPIPGFSVEGIPDYTNLTVVGVKEQTEVEVTLTHQTQGSKDGKIPAGKAGDTIKVTLGPFDVLNINSIQDTGHITGDLSGSLVKASRPVAVFSGAARTGGPADLDSYNPPPPPWPSEGRCCTEHMEQQMFPTSALGQNFVVTHSAPRQKGTPEADFYRVFAVKDGTTTITTSITGYPKLTVEAGKWASFWSTHDFVLTADKPVMVGQYTVNQDYLDSWAGPSGDSDFVLFAPVEQHRKDYIFLTPNTFTADFVIVAAPVGATVKLDGKDVNVEMSPLCARFPAGTVKGETYNALRCPVQDGVHRLEASKPVGIMVYGYYNAGSYAYPGGADIRQINID